MIELPPRTILLDFWDWSGTNFLISLTQRDKAFRRYIGLLMKVV